MGDLSKLKELVFETDNNACFIERERILNRLELEYKDYDKYDKYALILSKLLSEVSTPINDCDYFAGRVLEDIPDDGMVAPNHHTLCSFGHLSFDYERLLKIGLKGILERIKTNAVKKGDQASLSFAHNAEIVVDAIRDFAKRYAKAAKEKGNDEMAKALEIVPFEPAYDFYSALQGIWIIHFIASCYVGNRDYAFGRFDKYMLPFYEKAIKDGKSKEELTELLAGFMVKSNEICGRCAHNYNSKPVLSQSSKQYINIGGENPNVFSSVVLDAAKLLNMAQPQIVVLLKPDADEKFTEDAFSALSVLTDKMNFYNYDLVLNALLEKGIDEDVAKDFTYSACCSFDLGYHTFRLEKYLNAPSIFLKTLNSKEFESTEEIISEFENNLKDDIQNYADFDALTGCFGENARKAFVLDGILLSDSADECIYACEGDAKYNILNVFFPGIATVGDSLMVIDKLVFKEKRYTYSEFMDIVKSDFENNEELRLEILKYTKFGNDTDADEYAVMAGNAFVNATQKVKLRDNFHIAPGFYSLNADNTWCRTLGATPDGRKSGTPFSENQSPSYGSDKNGITALLKSVAKLPFEKTVSGGLNIKFSRDVDEKVLKALITAYFEMGGIHVGISVINRETLQDAMENPDKYKSLTVRLYGFCEYFTSLPKWQQIAVLNRTEY